MDDKQLMEKITRARVSLVLKYPFFGRLALELDMKLMSEEFAAALMASGRVPTACVDGKSVQFYGPFIEYLSEANMLFLVAHEVLHPAFLHNFRRGNRDPMRWNMAADYVINQILTDEKVGDFIEGGCLDRALYEKGGGSTDGVYNLLPVQDDPDNPEGNGPGGTGMDLEDGGKTAGEAEQQAGEWKVVMAQAAQAAKMCGKLSANLERLVSEALYPKLNWREVLQNFVEKARTDARSFARPNRRFISQGLYLPSITGETLGELVFAVDMSGSISQDEVNQYAAECRIVHQDGRPTKLHIIYFSHEVCAHDVMQPEDGFTFKPRGGGGTAFSPVFRYIEEQGIEPVAAVFLTDLCCGDFGPPPGYPVLWVSTEREAAPFGTVIRM